MISEFADPPLSVFDNRAAAYAKLGDLQEALRDAKRMIHIGKSQVTVGAWEACKMMEYILLYFAHRATSELARYYS